MKRISIFLLDFASEKALSAALNSLKIIGHLVEDCYIFQGKYKVIKKQKMMIYIDVQEDLGTILNHEIQKLSSDYVLFLTDSDIVTAKSAKQISKLLASHEIITSTEKVKYTNITRPLLVNTAILKKRGFFPIHQLPFDEALLPSWLTNLEENSIFHSEDKIVKKAKVKNITDKRKKAEFLQKYADKQTISQLSNLSLTVCISNFNMESYIDHTIRSCLIQYEPADEILIMDDGSTDDSWNLLKKWETNSKIKVFQKENGGKAKALNDLLPHVTTDFILELDADDWLDPDAIGIIKSLLNSLPKRAAVLYGNFKIWKQATSRDLRYRTVKKGRSVKNQADLLSYRFPLGPRIYNTSKLKKVGGFPVIEFEDGRLFEDISVLYKLIANHAIFYQDFTVYNVREHSASITKNNHPNWNDYIKYIQEFL